VQGTYLESKTWNFFPVSKKVIVVGDNDEAGKSFNERIKSQLSNVVDNIIIWDWELLSIQTNQTFKKGFDFTDCATCCIMKSYTYL
jgi:5S rRNA maturation endonuclease (ribonuclease M5)